MRQFEECSSQYEPLATIEEEGFALHYDGKANDATRDGAGQLRFCLRVATGEIHLRAKSYNDGTRDGTPGLTPQLARSSCVRCNPLELAHRISRERRERPQVRYLITRSFSEYSRKPGNYQISACQSAAFAHQCGHSTTMQPVGIRNQRKTFRGTGL